jgi:hypothetical protein
MIHMGIAIDVDVEGEESSPLEQRTDGKPLADVVSGWIWDPVVVSWLGLSSKSVEVLERVEMSAYGEPGEKPQDVWQDPKVLRTALEELRGIFRRIKSTPSLIEEMEGVAADHFYRDSLEADAYDANFEDAIKVCEWAMKLSKRVRLRAG